MVRKFVFDNSLILLAVAAIAGILLISGDLVMASSRPAHDCPDGLDCPPSEHASENAKPPSSIPAGIAKTRKMGPDSCASPFRFAVEPGGEGRPAISKCVLDGDLVLNETLELSSFTTLDCQNHAMLSSRNGTNLTWPGGRSNPEVAIFLNGVHGVSIENCIIEGFDFGIFGINSKVSADGRDDERALEALRNRITWNRINSRFVPISLLSVDNTEIDGNTLGFSTRGGIGVNLARDSDINHIKNNNITGNFSSTGSAVRAPGPSGPSNSLVTASTGAFIMQTVGAEPTVLNAIVGGALYQLPISDSFEPDENFSEGNLFEGNVVTFPQTRGEGVFFGASRGTVIRSNTISHSTNAIRAGGIDSRQFPSTCTLNAARLCLDDFDCNITGFDNASQGTCDLPPSKNVSWRAINATIENNTLPDSSTSGISTIAENLLLKGNKVNGGPLGISITGFFALQTAVITRNNVSNVTVGLFLQKTFQNLAPSFFGAKISLNDFTNYTIAVQTSNDYNLSSNLTEAGKGNYWGLPCPGFNSTKVRFLNGTINPYVNDSHPYGVSVANIPDASLPASCN